jgi:hypothetical protein
MTSKRFRRAATAVITGVLLAVTGASADPLQSAVDERIDAQHEAAASQQRIDALAEETAQLLGEYRAALAEAESLQVYVAQLERLIDNQDEELASLDRQLQSIETTRRRIVPLMLRMVDVLEGFVALDLPFLPEERGMRIASLKELMDRADVSLAEKFRRVLEAYQVEMDYGRTLEAYRGTLADRRTVEFLRVGRVALFYRTLDGSEVGQWDSANSGWMRLPPEYAAPIQQGLRIARKESPPELIRLPVRAPEPLP